MLSLKIVRCVLFTFILCTIALGLYINLSARVPNVQSSRAVMVMSTLKQ